MVKLNLPAVGLRNEVQIPRRANSHSFLSGNDRQSFCLGEARTLETETKTAEIMAGPVRERAAAPGSHCLDEFGLGHPGTVVQHANSGLVGRGVRENIYVYRAGRDRIVY